MSWWQPKRRRGASAVQPSAAEEIARDVASNRPGDDAPSRAWAFWYVASAPTDEERRSREAWVKSFLESVIEPARVATPPSPHRQHLNGHANGVAMQDAIPGFRPATDLFGEDSTALQRDDEFYKKLAEDEQDAEFRAALAGRTVS